MNRKVINLLLFQVGWLSCVLGVAWKLPLLGPVFVALWLGLYLVRSRQIRSEGAILFGAGVIGFIFDSILISAGVLIFSSAEWTTRFSPLWMVALWLNLAGTLNESLQWLSKRYLLAALLGGVGGPLGYYAGFRLDAIQFREPLSGSLCLVAIEWLVAMPLLVGLADWALSRKRKPNKRMERE